MQCSRCDINITDRKPIVSIAARLEGDTSLFHWMGFYHAIADRDRTSRVDPRFYIMPLQGMRIKKATTSCSS